MSEEPVDEPELEPETPSREPTASDEQQATTSMALQLKYIHADSGK